MHNSLSPKDYETLSAYLDGQLSPRDRAKVESRIQTRPEWRTEFEELRSTRLLLRSLPKHRAPRNFTLTPAMVAGRQRQAPRAYPFFRLASAVASALLIVVFASDLAINLTAQSLARSAASAPAPAAAPAERTLTDQGTAATEMMQEAPLLTAPQQALPTQAAAAAATPTPEATATQAQEMALNAAPAAGPTEPVSGGCTEGCEPQPTPTPEEGFNAAGVPNSTETILGQGGGEPAQDAPTPVIDETQHASRAMTAAPPGKGGGPGPDQAETPGGFRKMAPETATPEPAAPFAAVEAPTEAPVVVDLLPPAVEPTADALVPPAVSDPALDTQSQVLREGYPPAGQASPFNAVPGLRLAEAFLAGVAIITGIAALWLRLRSGS